MSISRTPIPGLICFALCLACDASQHDAYRIQIDVRVLDEDELCRHAWSLAEAQNGRQVAQMFTTTAGEFDVAKCLGAVYQISAPGSLQSVGIEVSKR